MEENVIKTKLYWKGLPINWKEYNVFRLFKCFGVMKNVFVPEVPSNYRFRYGSVEFSEESMAVKAKSYLNGLRDLSQVSGLQLDHQICLPRPLLVDFYRNKPHSMGDASGPEYKDMRDVVKLDAPDAWKEARMKDYLPVQEEFTSPDVAKLDSDSEPDEKEFRATGSSLLVSECVETSLGPGGDGPSLKTDSAGQEIWDSDAGEDEGNAEFWGEMMEPTPEMAEEKGSFRGRRHLGLHGWSSRFQNALIMARSYNKQVPAHFTPEIAQRFLGPLSERVESVERAELPEKSYLMDGSEWKAPEDGSWVVAWPPVRDVGEVRTNELQALVCAALNARTPLQIFFGISDEKRVVGHKLDRWSRDAWRVSLDMALSSGLRPPVHPELSAVHFLPVSVPPPLHPKPHLYVVRISIAAQFSTMKYQVISGKIFVKVGESCEEMGVREARDHFVRPLLDTQLQAVSQLEREISDLETLIKKSV